MNYEKNIGNSNIPISNHMINIAHYFPSLKSNILVSYIYGIFLSIYNQKSEENIHE